MRLEIKRLGDEASLVLPKELLLRLGVGPGDALHAVVSEDGVVLLKHDPAHEAQLASARRSLRQYRTLYEKLSKA